MEAIFLIRHSEIVGPESFLVIDSAAEFDRILPVAISSPPAAGLWNLVRAVAIGIAVLDGLGRADEARVLRAALLDGREDDAVRALAARELAASGTIFRALGEHQMAQEGHAPPA